MLQTEVRPKKTTARIIGNIVAWILAVILAVAFTMAGGIKLISRPNMIQEFAEIGFGQWLRYLTGILEVSGAIGVLIPAFRFWASLQIAVVMTGATITNLAILHQPATARITAFLLALALALALLRRQEATR